MQAIKGTFVEQQDCCIIVNGRPGRGKKIARQLSRTKAVRARQTDGMSVEPMSFNGLVRFDWRQTGTGGKAAGLQLEFTKPVDAGLLRAFCDAPSCAFMY